MVHIMSLWLPIVVSSVLVFVVSSILHMFLKYHQADYKKLPSEDAVLDAFRKFNISPGDYMAPRPESMKEMKEPAFQEKCRKGPKIIMTVMPVGLPSMGPQLAQWFLYSLVVGVFSAYLAGRALPPGAPYLAAFRFAGTAAFLSYGMAEIPHSIWYKRSWGTTYRQLFDALVYGCVTGGAFGWLWPK